MLQRERVCFLIKNLSKLSEIHYMEPYLYPSITDIVEEMNTLIQERHNHSESSITVKGLEECKKLRFNLQMKDLVSHSVVRKWDTISVAMLAMNLE